MNIETIGILVVFTGRYVDFFPNFYNTMEINFLPNKKKIYFCFTDTEKKIKYDNVVRIYKKYEGFPQDTLYRYRMFTNASDIILKKNVDVLYYLDVDMKITGVVGEEILPKLETPLVSVLHPGYYKKHITAFPYENRRESNAFINKEGVRIFSGYMAGGVQGGITKFYLKTAKIISKMIDDDGERDIIAKWHDESYWNKFVFTYSELFHIMTPSYCYPETVSGKNYASIRGLKRKIIALDKDHKYYRFQSDKRIK